MGVTKVSREGREYKQRHRQNRDRQTQRHTQRQRDRQHTCSKLVMEAYPSRSSSSGMLPFFMPAKYIFSMASRLMQLLLGLERLMLLLLLLLLLQGLERLVCLRRKLRIVLANSWSGQSVTRRFSLEARKQTKKRKQQNKRESNKETRKARK